MFWRTNPMFWRKIQCFAQEQKMFLRRKNNACSQSNMTWFAPNVSLYKNLSNHIIKNLSNHILKNLSNHILKRHMYFWKDTRALCSEFNLGVFSCSKTMQRIKIFNFVGSKVNTGRSGAKCSSYFYDFCCQRLGEAVLSILLTRSLILQRALSQLRISPYMQYYGYCTNTTRIANAVQRHS